MGISTRQFITVTTLLMTLSLGACGGGSSSNGTLNPPPPPPIPPPATGPNIALAQVFPGLSFSGLVKLLQAPDDSSRWFAVDQRGQVWVFDNDPDVSAATLFIEISGRVDSGPNEAGLLGMAFHPDWGLNGNFEVFLSYTRSGSPLDSAPRASAAHRVPRFSPGDCVTPGAGVSIKTRASYGPVMSARAALKKSTSLNSAGITAGVAAKAPVILTHPGNAPLA